MAVKVWLQLQAAQKAKAWPLALRGLGGRRGVSAAAVPRKRPSSAQRGGPQLRAQRAGEGQPLAPGALALLSVRGQGRLQLGRCAERVRHRRAVGGCFAAPAAAAFAGGPGAAQPGGV
ncbi:unnamed protein product, partial [Effrenium voratum]